MTGRDYTFNEFQHECEQHWYADVSDELSYAVLAMVGEAGEVANELKKAIRDDDAVLTSDRASKLASELGNVLFYCARVARQLGFPLEAVARNQISLCVAHRLKTKINEEEGR